MGKEDWFAYNLPKFDEIGCIAKSYKEADNAIIKLFMG